MNSYYSSDSNRELRIFINFSNIPSYSVNDIQSKLSQAENPFSKKDLQKANKVIEQIKEQLLFGEFDLEKNLFSFYYIAQKLNLEEGKKWAEEELQGYEDFENLPKYRQKVFCHLTYRGTDQKIAESIPQTIKEPFRMSVPKIIVYVKRDKQSFNFVANLWMKETLRKKLDTELNFDEITVVLLKSDMIGMLGSIKVEFLKKIQIVEKVIQENLESEVEEEIEYDPKKIFVVHGRDITAKNDLVKILKERLELEPIVLMDEPNEGRTIIEKIEKKSLKVGFAFVILTPDDIGLLKEKFDSCENLEQVKDSLELRARQNAILELGYFTGKLGRNRVCCLQKGSDELVTGDLHGLLTIRFNNSIREVFLDIENELKKIGMVN